MAKYKIIAEYLSRTEYETQYEDGDGRVLFDKVVDSYTEDVPQYLVREFGTATSHDGRVFDVHDDLERFESYDEARAFVYYVGTYKPDFKEGEGEPVCFKEFYNNDWKEVKQTL